MLLEYLRLTSVGSSHPFFGWCLFEVLLPVLYVHPHWELPTHYNSRTLPLEGELEVSGKIAAFTEESQCYLTARERLILQLIPEMNIVLNMFTLLNHLRKDSVFWTHSSRYFRGSVPWLGRQEQKKKASHKLVPWQVGGHTLSWTGAGSWHLRKKYECIWKRVLSPTSTSGTPSFRAFLRQKFYPAHSA